MLIVSGYLPTFELAEPIEKRCRIPVVSATCMHSAREFDLQGSTVASRISGRCSIVN
jgi:hypothetical protein